MSHNYSSYLKLPLFSPGKYTNAELSMAARIHSRKSIFFSIVAIHLINRARLFKASLA